MPFLLIIAGAVLLIAGVRNTVTTTTSGGPGLFTLLQGDFTSTAGQPNFLYWFVSILIIGAIGYIGPLKPIANAFLVLIVVALVFTDSSSSGGTGNVFQRFTQALKTTTTTQPAANTPVSTATTVGSTPDLSSYLLGVGVQ